MLAKFMSSLNRYPSLEKKSAYFYELHERDGLPHQQTNDNLVIEDVRENTQKKQTKSPRISWESLYELSDSKKKKSNAKHLAEVPGKQ